MHVRLSFLLLLFSRALDDAVISGARNAGCKICKNLQEVPRGEDLRGEGELVLEPALGPKQVRG